MALVKYNNNSISAVTTTGIPSGSLVPIKTLTASSSETLSFVHGTDGVVLDSTYPIYKFEFINIHPATNGANFQFQGNASGGSGYNETITSTMFMANHDEGNTTTQFGYEGGYDLAQGTGFQALQSGGLIGNGNDECLSGQLTIYNPSSTVFVKHFIVTTNQYSSYDYSINSFVAGYFNTTSAIDEIQFKMASGNIDDGKIKLYGIKDS